MSFTDELHRISKELWDRSKSHPFIKELVSGELSEERFRYYLVQDTYYLKHFEHAHTLIIDRTDDEKLKQIQRECRSGLNEAEIVIREDFLAYYDVSDAEVNETQIAPTPYAYTSHIYRHIHEGSLLSALCSLLPCYWLYAEIGHEFVDSHSPHKMYQAFLETYDSDGFNETLNKQISLIDELATNASDTELKEAKEAFLMSSEYELNFWEMAYTKERWSF